MHSKLGSQNKFQQFITCAFIEQTQHSIWYIHQKFIDNTEHLFA